MLSQAFAQRAQILMQRKIFGQISGRGLVALDRGYRRSRCVVAQCVARRAGWAVFHAHRGVRWSRQGGVPTLRRGKYAISSAGPCRFGQLNFAKLGLDPLQRFRKRLGDVRGNACVVRKAADVGIRVSRVERSHLMLAWHIRAHAGKRRIECRAALMALLGARVVHGVAMRTRLQRQLSATFVAELGAGRIRVTAETAR